MYGPKARNRWQRLLGLCLLCDGKCHGQGVGSEILRQMREQYRGKGVFLEIETVKESAENYEERKRRKQFYLSNGMRSLGVFVELFGVEMELLGFDCKLTFEEYHAFYRDNYNAWAAEHVKRARLSVDDRME